MRLSRGLSSPVPVLPFAKRLSAETAGSGKLLKITGNP